MQQKIPATNSKLKILLVEDDPHQRELINEVISADYEAIMVDNGESALQIAESLSASLVIMDLDIPRINGFEICRRLRLSPSTRNLPIIMLTGTMNQDIKVAALDVGADDYVEKPFYGKELLSRIRARLRNQTRANIPDQDLTCGSLRLDLQRMEAKTKEITTPLSLLECSLLAMFMKNSEAVLSREVILSKAWGNTAASRRTVDTHVVSIRKAIEPSDYRIETIYGAGYMFTASPRKPTPGRKS